MTDGNVMLARDLGTELGDDRIRVLRDAGAQRIVDRPSRGGT